MTKKNQYDITVDATVIDVTKKPDGVYRVKTTGAEFEAYATAGSYYKNDIVLVQIPNGDYKNPKFILGRKADVEANKTFSFKLPFDDFIGLINLDGAVGSTTFGNYWANWPETSTDQYKLLQTQVWHWEGNGDSTIGNTRLGIQADWQTFLGEYFPLRGSFGFRIIVKGVTASTEITEASEIEREYYFTNVDMYGDPYSYQTPYAQQKVLDISDFLKVTEINVYFYQDFNFADHMNVPISYEEKGLVPYVPPNIMFNKLEVFLGVAAEDIKDEATYIYTYQPLTYESTEKTYVNEETGDIITKFECDEKKIILFTWVHYESDGTYSVIKDVTDLALQRNKAGKTTHLFWYRYDYEATTEDNIWKAAHADLKLDWEDGLNNPNYETKMERYGGPHWTLIPAATDDFAYTFTPRGDKSREKFKVVVQHDGTHTTSQEIVFRNGRDIEAEILAGAKNDSVIIKTYKLAKVKNSAGQWTQEYEAIEDGSINAFHVYDENNKILVNDDGERFDAHYYYLQIHKRDDITNLYDVLTTVAENGTATGTSIAWAFPRNFTMIRSTEEVSMEDAKYFGIDPVNEPVRWQNFHNGTVKFTIQSTFNNRNLDNVVGAIIHQNGKDYHIEKNLMFGRAEGLGHEYLPVLEIVAPVGNTYIHTGTEFEIACAVYNKDGSLYENPNLLTFTWRELSGKCEFFYENDNKELVDGYHIGKYEGTETSYIEKYKGYRANVIRGRLKVKNNEMVCPPIFEVTVNGAASYPLTVRSGFMVCGDYKYKQVRDYAVPSRVEFKSDGADPIFYSDYFEVARLTSKPDAILAEYDIEYPEWKISETPKNIFSLERITTPRELIEYDDDGNIVTADHGYTRYKLIFNDGPDAHPQWTEDYLKPECYTYIYYTDTYTAEDGTTVAVDVSQSIAFDRNYYPSSLVNEWDGTSLTWDEENGAILSTMIAAGSKDNNNRFTGVMMGDWHVKGDESLDMPGLYGYNKGAQTFGFKTDGTGFIGGSGKGRIEFDGTEAVISNPDRSCYINLNPVNLQARLTDINNQSFSENFIYCRVRKTDNLFDSISDSINSRTSWAQKYFQDNNNDYFVVDPNYGVLTTGGVIARYGALGNWMISNEGLYQKSDNAYMYMGFDETDVSRASTWQAMKSNLLALKRNYETLVNNQTTKTEELRVLDSTIESKEANKTTETARLNSEIATAQAAINAAVTEANALNTTIEELTASISGKGTEIQNLQTSRGALYSSITEKQNQVRDLEDKIAQVSNKLTGANNTYADALVEIEGYISECNNFNIELNEYTSQLVSYKNELNTLTGQRTKYVNARAEAETVVATWTANIEDCKAEMAKKESQLETVNNQIHTNEELIADKELEIRLSLAGKDLDQTVQSSKTYQETVDLIEDEIVQYEEEIIPALEEALLDETLTEKEREEKASALANAQNELSSLNSDREFYETLVIMAQEIEALEADNVTLGNQASTLQDEISTLNSNLTTMETNLTEAQKIYDTNNNALIIIENSLLTLKNTGIGIRTDLDKIYDKLVIFKETALSTSEESVSKGELTENELQSSNAPSKYGNNVISDTLEHHAYISRLILILEANIKYLQYRVDKEEGTFTKALNARRNSLLEQIENDPELSGYSEEIANYRTQIATLQLEIDNPEYYNDPENQTPGLRQLINIYTESISKLQVEIENLETQKTQKKAELTTQNNIIALNTNLIAGYNNDIKTLQKEIDDLKAYKVTLQNQITDITSQLAKLRTSINDKQKEVKDAIIAAGIDSTYTINNLNSDSTLSDAQTVIDTTVTAIDEIIFHHSIRYAIYIATKEPNVGNLQVLPFFSVDWEGTMFARKGIIANTWKIDDYSLTYKKNNGILYLGTEQYVSNGAATEGANYEPKGRAVSLTDPRRWAISASDQYPGTDTEEYLINFGVSLSGELYAQLGTIAGWQISQTTITSPATNGSSIVLDAANNQIRTSNNGFILDGSSGTLVLNAGMGDSNNSNAGLLYLAEYLLMGRTVTESLTYSNYQQGETKTTPRAIGGMEHGYGWGDVSVGGATIYTESNEWITNLDFALNGQDSNYLQFLDAGHQISPGVHPGAVLVTGTKQGSNDSSDVATVFYPVKTGGILGLTGHRWNLVADSIDASLINAGGINGTELYEAFERVATQKWVTNALADLWNAISDVSGDAAAASRKSHALSITKVELNCYPTYNPLGWTGVIVMTRGNNTTIQSNVRDVNLSHEHEVSFNRSGSTLTCGVDGATSAAAAKTVSLSHTHKPSFSFSGGVVSCTIGDANFDSTSSSGSFNVANTSWFKNQINQAYKDGHSDGYSEGFRDGEDAASCDRYHEGDSKRVGSTRYVLKWVA